MRLRLSTFRRGFASTLVLDVAARALSAIATVLFVRSLGVASFAYVVLFLNIGQFAGSALTGGLRMRYMRVEAERVSREDDAPTGFAPAWIASLGVVGATTALFYAGVATLEGPLSEQALFVALTGLFTAGQASVELAMYHHQAHLQFVRAGLIGIARGAVLLAIALATTTGAVTSGEMTATLIAGGTLVVALIPCLPLAARAVGPRIWAQMQGDWRRESGWLTIYFLASASVSYAAIFVVAAFLDDEAVASYGAALRYVAIVLGPLPALLAVLRVRTSQHDIVDSAQQQTHLLLDWIRRSTVPVALALALVAAAAPVLIPALDDGRYPDSIPVFQIMLITALFTYTTMPGPNLLMSQRRYRLLATVYSAGVVIQLGALALAASQGGLVPLAATNSFARCIEAVTIAYLAWRLPP